MKVTNGTGAHKATGTDAPADILSATATAESTRTSRPHGNEANGATSAGLRSVSKAHPCPVCGKSKWCRVRDDGKLCICRHQSEGAESTGTDTNGKDYYTHHLAGYQPRNRAGRPADRKKVGGRGSETRGIDNAAVAPHAGRDQPPAHGLQVLARRRRRPTASGRRTRTPRLHAGANPPLSIRPDEQEREGPRPPPRSASALPRRNSSACRAWSASRRGTGTAPT